MAERMRSRMAADWSQAEQGPPPPRDDDEHQDVDEPADEPADDDEDQDDDEPADDEGRPARSLPAAPGWANDGAGFVLGLLLWGWVVLPFVKGGPKRVGAVLRAKFLNQASDGSELP